MANTFIGVREVDEDIYNKFRSLTVEQRLKLGEALTLAMRRYIEQSKKENRKKFLQTKPFSWGVGTEKLSEEADKILYR